ncbi:MAG: phytanoyl-CoA dioxygenase family protein [Pseudomonadota bacterium]
MDVLTPVRAVGYAARVFSADKSFVKNPILGSERLNRLGLHRMRVAAAAALTRIRRRAMASGLAPDRVADFERDGFVALPDFLPADQFRRLSDEVLAAPLPARERRQGQTVTRMIPLSAALRDRLPTAMSVVDDRSLRSLVGYAAGRSGQPVHYVMTVIAEPGKGAADPQTAVHSDTFHATAKFWLFLRDVGEDDGPFMYVPGSNRLTQKRLDWEYQQSISARADGRRHHGDGSLRALPSDLEAMGYPEPRRLPVAANTLVVADTFGFHARAASARPTKRVQIYGHLRRNPFLPWNGVDVQALPGIRHRQLDLYLWWLDRHAQRRGKAPLWRDVGEVAAEADASL